jgi:Ca2+-binding RTX toxin-like protein
MAGGATFTIQVNGATVQTSSVLGPACLGLVVAYGQAGDDRIQLVGLETAGGTAPFIVPAFLFGGDGDDSLDAQDSAANNVLVGGAGNDRLQGGTARNLLIGGAGEDQIHGRGGDDILIGGTTDYDNNLVALGAIMAEWCRTDESYAARIGHLGGQAGGVNGPYVLTGATVHDDAASDSLFGGGGLDWSFAQLTGPHKDKLNDAENG